MSRLVMALLLSSSAVSSAAIAGSVSYQLPGETADFKPGPGADSANLCSACHSADYVSTQPSKMGKAFWETEVQKMIKFYKAPINPTDAAAIVDYLAIAY